MKSSLAENTQDLQSRIDSAINDGKLRLHRNAEIMMFKTVLENFEKTKMSLQIPSLTQSKAKNLPSLASHVTSEARQAEAIGNLSSGQLLGPKEPQKKTLKVSYQTENGDVVLSETLRNVTGDTIQPKSSIQTPLGEHVTLSREIGIPEDGSEVVCIVTPRFDKKELVEIWTYQVFRAGEEALSGSTKIVFETEVDIFTGRELKPMPQSQTKAELALESIRPYLTDVGEIREMSFNDNSICIELVDDYRKLASQDDKDESESLVGEVIMQRLDAKSIKEMLINYIQINLRSLHASVLSRKKTYDDYLNVGRVSEARDLFTETLVTRINHFRSIANKSKLMLDGSPLFDAEEVIDLKLKAFSYVKLTPESLADHCFRQLVHNQERVNTLLSPYSVIQIGSNVKPAGSSSGVGFFSSMTKQSYKTEIRIAFA